MRSQFIVLLLVLFGCCQFLAASSDQEPWIKSELSKDRNQIVYNTEDVLRIMATLQSPPNKKEAKRIPIDISCVIDISGSMAGSKIALVRKALMYVVTKLQPEDRLSIVVFSDSSSTILTWTPMDDIGKRAAERQIITHVHELGSTNIGSGLQQSLELFKAKPTSDFKRANTMILFTDGETNIGITTPAEFQNLLQDYDTLLKDTQLSIHTFGFGAYHNSQLLSMIAESAKGYYYYIPNEEKVAEVFALCLSNAFQSYLNNVELFMETNYDVKTISYSYVQSKMMPQTFYAIDIGSMAYSEKKHVLIELTIPKENNPIDVKQVAKFTLSAVNSNGETMKLDLGEVSVERPFQPDPTKETVNIQLDEQLNRLKMKKAIEDSMEQAEKGSYHNAQQVLQDVESNIVASISSDTVFTNTLMQEIQKLKSYVSDASSYLTTGSKRMQNQKTAHTFEKSMSSDDQYVTEEVEEEVEEATKYFNS